MTRQSDIVACYRTDEYSPMYCSGGQVIANTGQKLLFRIGPASSCRCHPRSPVMGLPETWTVHFCQLLWMQSYLARVEFEQLYRYYQRRCRNNEQTNLTRARQFFPQANTWRQSSTEHMRSRYRRQFSSKYRSQFWEFLDLFVIGFYLCSFCDATSGTKLCTFLKYSNNQLPLHQGFKLRFQISNDELNIPVFVDILRAVAFSIFGLEGGKLR